MGAARPAREPELEVRLLGPLEVAKRRRSIPLGGPKPRALFAALALEPGRVVSVDRLVETLWPARTPETASHAVQVYVSQLRKLLGRAIATRPPGYVLQLEPDRIDVHRFARLTEEGRAALRAGDPELAETALREALSLWRGPALADFLYEPFAQAEIARLEELRLVALEERIEADLELGRHVDLVSELEALVQAEPLRERSRGQLMLALYRSGRQADALTAYRAGREALVDQLGIEPGPELKQLEAAILRQDESLLPEAADAAPSMQYRRLVTVLFADVVDSLALAQELDPETLHAVLRRYFDLVSTVLARHGGTVEKFAGDAVMAVFGVPVSHEDDALRAARAGLEIQARIAALDEALASELGVRLDVRVGLEAGEVLVAQEGARQRLVTGDTVGVVKRLEDAAPPGEIVVGALARRLIGNAGRFEELGPLAVKGKAEPVALFRLLATAAPAPAFGPRPEAPFVGRSTELGVLRKALRGAKSGSQAQLVAILGPAGIGKSRLAFELARRTRSVTVLSGRCLSYGDGITYWPLREMLRDAPESEERDAVLAALDAETPPSAPELGLLFRRLCESLARAKPLVLVFDDVHWAEPTLLELVEQLADRGEGPILAVCAARDELAEEHPDFLAECGRQLVLDTLTPEETEVLLDGLGATLADEERAHIVETAGGNPLFAEQLLALAAEGGLPETRALPITIQALLAARLDRLGPGERAVLERGAVIGEEFTAASVVALLDPAAAPTVPAHLGTLASRGFVRSAGDAFRFRHVLVQQAVYRAAPKRLRAELHERFADRLDETAADLPELDEFVGYHLEQAFTLRSELGEADRRSERLAEDAGARLGSAGKRAFRRADMPATRSLLTRATALLHNDSVQRALLVDLGLTRYASGDTEGAVDALSAAIEASEEAGDSRIIAWGRIELEFIELRREPRRTADGLLEAATAGIPILQQAADDRALGRAWVLSGWVQGGRRGDHAAWADAAQQALAHYKAAAWSTSTCLGQIAAALSWGPTPVSDAIARCELLLRDEVSDRAGRAYVLAFLGGLTAQQSHFDCAREMVGEAWATLGDLGLYAAMWAYCAPVLGEIELLTGSPENSVRTLREWCDQLISWKDTGLLASAASDLADTLVTLGSFEEAEEWTRVAEMHTASDDVHAQVRWFPVRGKLEAQRGNYETALSLTREGVERSEATDDLNRQAAAHRAHGHVLRLAGNDDEAALAFRRAIERYELKGNVAGAALVRTYQDDLAVV